MEFLKKCLIRLYSVLRNILRSFVILPFSLIKKIKTIHLTVNHSHGVLTVQ